MRSTIMFLGIVAIKVFGHIDYTVVQIIALGMFVALMFLMDCKEIDNLGRRDRW